jgi:PEP-CTERM motif
MQGSSPVMVSLWKSVKFIAAVTLGLFALHGGAKAAPLVPLYPVCPAIGISEGCTAMILINPDGSLSFFTDGARPYDGADDSLIGILNRSTSTVSSITLNSPVLAIYGFEEGPTGDGVQTQFFADGSAVPHYCDDNKAAGLIDASYSCTWYEGPQNFYSVTDGFRGVVNFINGGLSPGQSTWFGLEENLRFLPPGGIDGNAPELVTVPEPSTLVLFAHGLAGLALMRRRRTA